VSSREQWRISGADVAAVVRPAVHPDRGHLDQAVLRCLDLQNQRAAALARS